MQILWPHLMTLKKESEPVAWLCKVECLYNILAVKCWKVLWLRLFWGLLLCLSFTSSRLLRLRFLSQLQSTQSAPWCVFSEWSHLADIPVRHALAVIPQWQWNALQTAGEPWTDNMGGDRFTAQRSQPSSYVLGLSNWWVHFLTGPSGETGPGCL